MEILEKEKYSKLIEPLKKVTINNLFARAVVEQKVSGKVYVDDRANLETYYVVHPYGMSLLFGNHTNHTFNKAFKEYALNSNGLRTDYEWMQAFPGKWNTVLSDLFENCSISSSKNVTNHFEGVIELNTRINFRFSIHKYNNFKRNLPTLPHDIVRTDQDLFHAMKGSVIPSNFWDNADDFVARGVGFSLLVENQLACTAYSAFIFDDMLELGMETISKFRGKGFAKHTCARLIDFCLENNYQPVWACRLENTGSFRLAQALGFEPTLQIPYYRLCK